jgi:alpha-D-ribose 1-methylphosphonate 5-triphosphate synthase subunit PhnI
MQEAILRDAHIERATLVRTRLEGGMLNKAHLEGAYLRGAHLERAALYKVHLGGAFLSGTFFDTATYLEGVLLTSEKFGSVSLAGIHWNGVDLSVVDWAQLKMLGEEREAQQPRGPQGEEKDHAAHSSEYQLAARSNRQLALVLQEQGLYDEAIYFTYRARGHKHPKVQDFDAALCTVKEAAGVRYLDISIHGLCPFVDLRCSGRLWV